jgi:hypothetical protein
MYDVCREVTPAKYMDRTIAILDKDRTTKIKTTATTRRLRA